MITFVRDVRPPRVRGLPCRAAHRAARATTGCGRDQDPSRPRARATGRCRRAGDRAAGRSPPRARPGRSRGTGHLLRPRRPPGGPGRREEEAALERELDVLNLSLIHISEPTRLLSISYAV